jgi:hypothetical protein
VRVSTDETADVELEPHPVGAARGKLDLGGKSRHLAGGETARVKWRLSAREERSVHRALDRGRRTAVMITAEAADASGNPSEPNSLKIKLVR